MPLVPSWILRIHVPIGVSRRHPLAAMNAVLDVIRRSARAGRLGRYKGVSEISFGRERFIAPGASSPSTWTTIVITTYMPNASLDEVERFANDVAKAHPWEHPLIECSGPAGTFTWAPEQGAIHEET